MTFPNFDSGRQIHNYVIIHNRKRGVNGVMQEVGCLSKIGFVLIGPLLKLIGFIFKLLWITGLIFLIFALLPYGWFFGEYYLQETEWGIWPQPSFAWNELSYEPPEESIVKTRDIFRMNLERQANRGDITSEQAAMRFRLIDTGLAIFGVLMILLFVGKLLRSIIRLASKNPEFKLREIFTKGVGSKTAPNPKADTKLLSPTPSGFIFGKQGVKFVRKSPFMDGHILVLGGSRERKVIVYSNPNIAIMGNASFRNRHQRGTL